MTDAKVVPRLIKWRYIYQIILSERIVAKGTRDSDHLLTVHLGKISSDRLRFWQNVKGPTVYIHPSFPLLVNFVFIMPISWSTVASSPHVGFRSVSVSE